MFSSDEDESSFEVVEIISSKVDQNEDYTGSHVQQTCKIKNQLSSDVLLPTTEIDSKTIESVENIEKRIDVIVRENLQLKGVMNGINKDIDNQHVFLESIIEVLCKIAEKRKDELSAMTSKYLKLKMENEQLKLENEKKMGHQKNTDHMSTIKTLEKDNKELREYASQLEKQIDNLTTDVNNISYSQKCAEEEVIESQQIISRIGLHLYDYYKKLTQLKAEKEELEKKLKQTGRCVTLFYDQTVRDKEMNRDMAQLIYKLKTQNIEYKKKIREGLNAVSDEDMRVSQLQNALTRCNEQNEVLKQNFQTTCMNYLLRHLGHYDTNNKLFEEGINST